MKRILLFTFFLTFIGSVFAQKTIVNPEIGCSTAQNLKIKQIELSDSATIIKFHIKYPPEQWISIPKGTFIQAVGSNEKLFTTGTEGIQLGEHFWMPESGEADFSVIFPKIDPATTKIDYGEANAGGTWFIYDIKLKDSDGVLPKFASGHWYNQNTGDWEISFLDSIVIYKSKLWEYNDYTNTNYDSQVTLSNGDKILKLKINNIGEDNISIKENDKLVTYSKEVSTNIKSNNKDEAFKMPIFKMDTAYYSGFYKGYTPRIGVKTFTVITNDIISKNRETTLVNIQPDGSFSAKIPIYYPQSVFINSKLFRGSVFLEPGKSLFQMHDPMQDKRDEIFMGESSRINSELTKLKSLFSMDMQESMDKILEMSPKQFSSYCKSYWVNDIQKLDSLLAKSEISKKAWQLSKFNLDYGYANKIMRYKWTKTGAYRRKHNIPRNQRTLPVKIESPSPQDFDFINTEFINNPLAVTSNSFPQFISMFSYADFLRPDQNRVLHEAVNDLKNSNHSLTNYEIEIISIYNKTDSISQLPENKSFEEKYKNQKTELFIKYNSEVNELRKTSKNKLVGILQLAKKISENGSSLTNTEKDLIEAYQNHEKTASMMLLNELKSQYQDSISTFLNQHNENIMGIVNKNINDFRTKKLKEYYGIEKGFFVDIQISRNACEKIVREMIPISEVELQKTINKIEIPFIKEHLILCNNQTKQKLKDIKFKNDCTVNTVPKDAGENVFETIMQKYKGRVVYVDFWATWCGPCRSGITRIKPLKEEMSKDDVAFVYITNNSSPENKWKSMISDIKGEHYRVSKDEWNYLSSKFNITGIPHYVLVDKNGTVVKPHLRHMNNDGLKTMLNKYIEQ